jgi:hypothetical protein
VKFPEPPCSRIKTVEAAVGGNPHKTLSVPGKTGQSVAFYRKGIIAFADLTFCLVFFLC